MSEEFVIRRGSANDAAIIARHRARMFLDMGEISEEAAKNLQAKAEPLIAAAINEGTYLAWLATAKEDAQTILAGAGLQLHRIFPRPFKFNGVSEGKQAVIVNVYTEPQWRKRGLASRLIHEILEWSKPHHFDRLILHASPDGHSVYEKLGFADSNEMRFVGK